MTIILTMAVMLLQIMMMIMTILYTNSDNYIKNNNTSNKIGTKVYEYESNVQSADKINCYV